jgi:hypothetical protein
MVKFGNVAVFNKKIKEDYESTFNIEPNGLLAMLSGAKEI